MGCRGCNVALDPARIILNGNLLEVWVEDGQGQTFVCDMDKADFSAEGMSPILNTITPVQNRGHFRGVVVGERRWMSLSFSELVAAYTSTTGGPGTFLNFISGTGPYTGLLTSTLGPNQCLTLHVYAKYMTSRFGAEDQILKWEHCYFSWGTKAGLPTENTITAECWGELYVNDELFCREHIMGA
jgi:hypothetical protein